MKHNICHITIENLGKISTDCEHTRHDVVCPVLEIGAVLTRNSTVNTNISKINQIVKGDDSYAHIADFACDSTINLMLGLGLVFPTEHFSHLKGPSKYL